MSKSTVGYEILQSGIKEVTLIKIFNRYELVKELGNGATSHVYLAWDRLLFRKTAVKVGNNEELLLKEARCLSEFVKPCFPVLYDYAKEGESIYLFMEYVEGENLQERDRKSVV